MRVKIIYDKSVDSGFNPGDSQMLDEELAADVVKTGDAHYETPPKPAKKQRGTAHDDD